MTKYYLDLDLLKPYYIFTRSLHLLFVQQRTAVKVTNNYLIRFVDSDKAYKILKKFVEELDDVYFVDDEIKHQRIVVFNDDDLYLLENKR